MKNAFLIFTSTVIILLGFTVDSRADMCGDCMAMSGEGPIMGAGVMEMIKYLELDEKQASALKAVHLKMKKESIQRKAELQIAELELMELRSSDPVDLMAAEAKIRQIEALRSDLRISHLRTHEGVKGMLTPEQKIKLDSFMEKGTGSAMGRMRHCRMMGNMGGMGQTRQMEESDMQRSDGSGGHDIQPDEGHER
jgi:Spy/CpxP family protein refolding chaperone